MRVNLGRCLCGHSAVDHFAKQYKCYTCECQRFLDGTARVKSNIKENQNFPAHHTRQHEIPIYPLEYLPPWTPELGDWSDLGFVETLLLALSQAVYDQTGRVDWLSRAAVGFVYLIEQNVGEVKIGKAVRPHKRLSELQMGNPNRLTIWKAIPAEDRAALEASLHFHFASYRIRGEWFRPPVEEMRWLENVSYCIGSGDDLRIICGEDLRVDCCGEPHFFPVGEICPDDDLLRRNDHGNLFIINPEEVNQWTREVEADSE